MPTTIFDHHGGRALYYADGDNVFEVRTGRPMFYRGNYSNTLYSFAGGMPTFWIDTIPASGSELLPFGGVRGYLQRHDGGPPLYFEHVQETVESFAEKLFGSSHGGSTG